MSLFDIKPWLVKKNDGTKKQGMPQTTIKGVIGLEKELNSIETFIENLTGKKFDKNYQNWKKLADANDMDTLSGKIISTDQEYAMGSGIPTTTWEDGYAYLKLPTNTDAYNEISPQGSNTFYHTMTKGTTYTQTIWFETDAKLINSSGIQFTWFTYGEGHDGQPATLINLGENKYKLYSTYTWPGKSDNNVRLFDFFPLNKAFDLSTGTYLKFGNLMLEEGIGLD